MTTLNPLGFIDIETSRDAVSFMRYFDIYDMLCSVHFH